MNMRRTLSISACIMVAAVLKLSAPAEGYQVGSQFEVRNSSESIELITGSSQRLKFDYNVPELMVENPEVVQATPVAPNEILITGLKQGISTITVSDVSKKLQTITVNVTLDVRKLERAFEKHFPDSQIKVDALQTGVIISGSVARADQVSNVMSVARDFFPTNVINQLQVNGSQNIAIKVKIYEVSRTKLRKLGVDWSVIDPDFGIVSSVSQVIQSFSLTTGNATGNGNVTVGVINGDTQINAFIDALEVRQIAKLLDEPVLIAQNGRPAEFLSGGEVPIQVASGLGSNAIQFRPFGTKLDIVPIVQGQGQLTLEVRAEVSEIANDLAGESGVPGFRVRRVNTGVKMKAGHTLALAGDYREDSQSEIRGTPKLLDMPIVGTMFRKVQDDSNETELVFLITPRFISEVEPHQVPHLGPGQLTTTPSDRELLRDGYLEVPRCQDDCPIYDRFDESNPSSPYPPSMNYQSAQPVKTENSPQPKNASDNNQFQLSKQQPSNPDRTQTPAPREAKAFGGFNWPSLNR